MRSIPSSASLLLVVLLWAIGCQDDKVRESAVSQAMEPAAAAPSVTSLPPASGPPSGSTALDLLVGGRSAAAGKEVCLPVAVRGFNGIVSMQYTLQWDPALLDFQRLQGFALPDLNSNNFGTQLVRDGKLTHSWFDANIQGISRPDGSALYEICFQLKGGPGDQASISFGDVPTVREISDATGQLIPLNGLAGKVSIQ
jgi:hypothetical protein